MMDFDAPQYAVLLAPVECPRCGNMMHAGSQHLECLNRGCVLFGKPFERPGIELKAVTDGAPAAR